MKQPQQKNKRLLLNVAVRSLAIAIISMFSFGSFDSHGQNSELDFSLNSISVAPYNVEPGIDSLRINVTYAKSDTGQNSYYNYIEFFISEDSLFSSEDAYFGYAYIQDQAFGEATFVSVVPYVRPGTNYVIAALDPYNYIPESNKDNNFISAPLEVERTPLDLFFYDYSIPSALSTSPGTKLSYQYAIEKSGYVDNDSLQVGYYLSTDSVYNPGEDLFLRFNSPAPFFFNYNVGYVYDTLTLPQNIDLGNYFLITVIDPDNILNETKEFNNIAVTSLTVVEPFVDLYINYVYAYYYGVSSLPGDTLASSVVYTYYGIANDGSKESGNSSTAIFLSSDPNLDSNDILLQVNQELPVLGNSTRYSELYLNLPYNLESGNHYLIVIADYYNENNDVDTYNNTYTTNIYVPGGPKPNLTLVSSSSSPRITTESYGTHSVFLKNTGELPADYVDVEHYLVSAQGEYIQYLGYTNTQYLNPGQIAQQEVYFYLPYEGVFFIRSQVDPYGYIDESNENDNTIDEKIIYYNITSLDKANEKGGISISPNPAQESFTIFNGLESGNASYNLYNNLGEIVRSQKGENSESILFDCSGIAKGIYFLKTESDGKLKQQKVILY